MTVAGSDKSCDKGTLLACSTICALQAGEAGKSLIPLCLLVEIKGEENNTFLQELLQCFGRLVALEIDRGV